MCNNDVIIDIYYYIVLLIIDLCAKCRQKGVLAFWGKVCLHSEECLNNIGYCFNHTL